MTLIIGKLQKRNLENKIRNTEAIRKLIKVETN